MPNLIVAGIGTDVGKTLVSAVLVKALKADYWKPVQSGSSPSDSAWIKELVQEEACVIHPESYVFKTPLSPHTAAAMEGVSIDPASIVVPSSYRPIIIECAGGLLVPFTDECLQLDLFSKWDFHWILVSKHYLGSINHTLLAMEALRSRHVNLLGIIFNGEENSDTERVILKNSRSQMLGRLSPEPEITPLIISTYAKKWQKHPLLAPFNRKSDT